MPDDFEWLDDDLVVAVELLADAFKARSIQYALVGGLALGFRGNPRFTQDVYVVLNVPQLTLPGLLEDLAKQGFGFDTTTVIRQYVQEHMTVLHVGQIQIELDQAEVAVLSPSNSGCYCASLDGGPSRTNGTTECLVVTKLAAFRLQDQADIESLLSANRDTIDLDLIRAEWAAVVDEDDERSAWLEKTIARLLPSLKQ